MEEKEMKKNLIKEMEEKEERKISEEKKKKKMRKITVRKRTISIVTS